MYKVMFKLYDKGGEATDENARGCSVYPVSYTNFRCVQDMLRAAFGITKEHKEIIPQRLGDHKVIRSYFDPDFDRDIMARFYIIEEDD